jgi:trans-feruloyl-CoA hydratase/vanillin synthase
MPTDRPESDTVASTVEDGIAWVRFNRPEKKNAMSRKLNRQMLRVLDDLEFRDDVGVLVLAADGDAWSAGMDLQEYFREPESEGFEEIRRSQMESYGWFARLRNFEKVTIAMIDGWCFGGAYAPLYACDLAFCSDESKFGLSEVNWGILPGGGASKVVVDLMPLRDAMYHALMGENLTGQQASAARLVNESLPADQLEARVREVATALLAKNWPTLKATKRTIRATRLMEYDQALDYQVRAQEALMYIDRTRGREEAMRQFLDEKSFKPGLGVYDKQRATGDRSGPGAAHDDREGGQERADSGR